MFGIKRLASCVCSQHLRGGSCVLRLQGVRAAEGSDFQCARCHQFLFFRLSVRNLHVFLSHKGFAFSEAIHPPSWGGGIPAELPARGLGRGWACCARGHPGSLQPCRLSQRPQQSRAASPFWSGHGSIRFHGVQGARASGSAGVRELTMWILNCHKDLYSFSLPPLFLFLRPSSGAASTSWPRPVQPRDFRVALVLPWHRCLGCPPHVALHGLSRCPAWGCGHVVSCTFRKAQARLGGRACQR